MSCLKIWRNLIPFLLYREVLYFPNFFLYLILILSKINPILFLTFSLFFNLALVNLKILSQDLLIYFFFCFFFYSFFHLHFFIDFLLILQFFPLLTLFFDLFFEFFQFRLTFLLVLLLLTFF
jgi:hypothetical protein